MDYLKSQIDELNKKITELEALKEKDAEVAQLADEELSTLKEQRATLEAALNSSGNSSDVLANGAIVEIRAAAGGDESGLFAGVLYRMYTRYAADKGWKCEQISINEGGLGNIKEVIFRIGAPVAYKKLKYESGVHRVQRVPETESAGRVHTSTVTVAVLPEVTEKDFHLNLSELKIDTFRAGGHGGQNVQKVETAVRITHLPTGLTAVCQSERSQFQNKEKALNIIRSRLAAKEEEEKLANISSTRNEQIGTGDRSEKIRTYNYPQDRITDHRLGKSFHNIEGILDGHLDPIMEELEKQTRDDGAQP